MIEVLALAGAVTKIATGVTAAVRAGKDVQSLMPHFGKLSELDAEIQAAEAGRHKSPIGRLTSSESEGFAIAQAKMAHQQAQKDLKSACLLYGPPKMWDMVVAEQAAARKRKAAAIKEAAKRRDKFFWIISLIVGAVVFVAGTTLLLYIAEKAAHL
jgi:hypothetical protein